MAGGGWLAAVVMFLASLIVILPMASAVTAHVVGGSVGWVIPPNPTFYANWSTSQKFAIGDFLVFDFPASTQTVVEVPESSFDDCSISNQISVIKTRGPAAFKLASDGEHYYIYSTLGRCSLNQKLSVTVSANPSPEPGD